MNRFACQPLAKHHDRLSFRRPATADRGLWFLVVASIVLEKLPAVLVKTLPLYEVEISVLNQAVARERRRCLRQAQHASPQAAPTATPPRRPIDFVALRALIPIAAVLELLGFQPRSTRGTQQRGGCPLHGSTSGKSRSFSVNLQQNNFHCFRCNRSGNALDLWAAATKQLPYDAALDLCQRLNLNVPYLPLPQSRNREEEPVSPTITENCTIPGEPNSVLSLTH